MGYVDLLQRSVYCPSDDIIINNAPEKATSAPHSTYQQLKVITLTDVINPNSKFRFKFELKNADAATGTYGKVYRNGIAVGSEQSMSGVAWTAFSEDIDLTSWKTNDTIELWVRSGNIVQTAYCKNFQMCGVSSEFLNTTV